MIAIKQIQYIFLSPGESEKLKKIAKYKIFFIPILPSDIYRKLIIYKANSKVKMKKVFKYK